MRCLNINLIIMIFAAYIFYGKFARFIITIYHILFIERAFSSSMNLVFYNIYIIYHYIFHIIWFFHISLKVWWSQTLFCTFFVDCWKILWLGHVYFHEVLSTNKFNVIMAYYILINKCKLIINVNLISNSEQSMYAI